MADPPLTLPGHESVFPDALGGREHVGKAMLAVWECGYLCGTEAATRTLPWPADELAPAKLAGFLGVVLRSVALRPLDGEQSPAQRMGTPGCCRRDGVFPLSGNTCSGNSCT
ncbi:hypothetical protein COT77_03000 [Candidatus Berkelbacteria bacterium CG10_big_fil_rev_8_21_14_0_10_41_12]|uniref:Uncharacterized protein n=1 Tax=Candidatus Berkelbacteria bacterium CG10_big_fil_rev_8_21_14_0_10_41_12 TaxID=1974513 RepID=A0A2M6WWM6_9BACT|nr:MAG: hypothetical protein COT77_03000 [Candidatus Berkelbacteria bacterium CG10_big_fil_rev_8_21_14_0_10_41_12]